MRRQARQLASIRGPLKEFWQKKRKFTLRSGMLQRLHGDR